MTIDTWLDRADANTPAIYFEGKTITYGGVRARTHDRIAQFRAAGLTKGDRIAWLGLGHPEVFVLLFAAAKLGLILVPLNWRLSRAELATIIADCGPKYLIHDDAFADLARQLNPGSLHHTTRLPEGNPSSKTVVADTDPLLIVYTSGSTGTPKGVVLSQRAIKANAVMSVDAHGLTARDRALVVLPLFHVGGLNILPTPCFSVGAAVDLHARFDPCNALAALEHATTAIMVPTVLSAIMAQPGWATALLRHLRVMSIGSTDVPRAMIRAVHARNIPMVQIYGATETAPLAIYQRADKAVTTEGSIGQSGSRCAIRLVANSMDVPQGEPGEIWVKGDNILSEYWMNPTLTARSLDNGWFKTGDVATCDPNGNFFFTDRIKNIIISGGENIYPAELERILNAHPDITEASVVGLPHPKWGQTPVAVVVSKSLNRDDVLSLFDGQIARFKHPSDVIFVPRLPRNAMGKVVPADVQAMITT